MCRKQFRRLRCSCYLARPFPILISRMRSRRTSRPLTLSAYWLVRHRWTALVVGGFTGQTPWEIHPETDELLYAVEGEAENRDPDGGRERGMAFCIRAKPASCRRVSGIVSSRARQLRTPGDLGA